MIKAIFFDVDGTLYCNDQNRVLPSTMTALRKLKEKGIEIFFQKENILRNIERDFLWTQEDC